jgi:hypothetical protein
VALPVDLRITAGIGSPIATRIDLQDDIRITVEVAAGEAVE